MEFTILVIHGVLSYNLGFFGKNCGSQEDFKKWLSVLDTTRFFFQSGNTLDYSNSH